MNTRLGTLLESGRILLMDGAMGTELLRAGAAPNDVARWSLTHPEAVRAVHRAYVEAGADLLLTNTFQVPEERADEIFAAALALARAAAPHRVVLADVGPLTSVTPAAVAALLARCRGGDGILLETWSDVDHVRTLARVHAEAAAVLPLLVSFAFRRSSDGRLRTFRDALPETCAQVAVESGAAALGVNCGLDIGLAEILEVVRAYRDITELPLLARANAGSPGVPGYPRSPEEMAQWVPALVRAGVQMIGGCCGTTPAHIAALRQAIDAERPRFV